MKDEKTAEEIEAEEINAKTIIIVPDGINWCAVRGDHISLQESPAGHGFNPELALKNLFEDETKFENEQSEKN